MAFKLEGAQDAQVAPVVTAPQISKPFKLEGAQDAAPTKDAISPKSDPSFSQRVSEDISKRKATEKKDVFQENQSPISAGLQGVGQYMAIGGDVAGEAAKSAINAVPESIKQPVVDRAKKVGSYVANTDLGKAGVAGAGKVVNALGDLAKEHPEAVRNIGAIGNIASAFPAGLGASAAEKGVLAVGEAAAPALKFAGESLTKAGEKQAAERKTKSFVDLISPKETKRVKEDNVGKTVEKGFLRKKEVVPDRFTSDVANTVSQVPGINPSRSYQHNYNQIAAENKSEAIKLNDALKTSNVTIPIEKINKAAINIRNSLAKQTFLVGDAKKVSDKMLEEAGSLIKKNGNTAAGLLKTRQEFDSWAKGQMGGDPFSDSNKARGASLKAVRDSLNNLISDAVPDAKVKESLKKQFHLYSALDNIQDKAAAEGKNILTRGIAKLEDVIPSNNALLRHGAAGAIGLGLATHPAGLAAAVPYGLYKGATSPTLKKVAGKGLTGLGEALSSKKAIPLPETKVLPEAQKLLPYYPDPKTFGTGKRTEDTAALMDKIKAMKGKAPEQAIRAGAPAAPLKLPAPGYKAPVIESKAPPKASNVYGKRDATRLGTDKNPVIYAEQPKRLALPDLSNVQDVKTVNSAGVAKNLSSQELQQMKVIQDSATKLGMTPEQLLNLLNKAKK